MIIFDNLKYFTELEYEMFEYNHKTPLKRKVLECLLWITDHISSVIIRTAMAKFGMKLSRKWGY